MVLAAPEVGAAAPTLKQLLGYTFVSDRVHAVLGHSPAELLHCPMVDLMAPEDGARMTALLRSAPGTAKAFHHEEFRCIAQDGRHRR